MCAVKNHDFAALFGAVACRTNLLDGSLAHEDVRAVLIGNHHGHSAAPEVEGDLVDLGEAPFRVQSLPHVHVFEDRHVQQVFQSGLVEAVELRIFEHPL